MKNMSIRRFEDTCCKQAVLTHTKVGGFMTRGCFDRINKIAEFTKFAREWFEEAVSKCRFLFGTSNPV